MPHFVASYAQEVTGITQNGEGPILDVSDYEHAGESMTCFTMVVKRTAGSTDSVNITIRVSLDGENFFDITGIANPASGVPKAVTSFSFGNNPAVAGFSGISFCYARYKVQNIGAGNTLMIQLLAGRA